MCDGLGGRLHECRMRLEVCGCVRRCVVCAEVCGCAGVRECGGVRVCGGVRCTEVVGDERDGLGGGGLHGRRARGRRVRGPAAVRVQLDLVALARQPRRRQHLLEVPVGTRMLSALIVAILARAKGGLISSSGLR